MHKVLATVSLILACAGVSAAAVVGQPAPAFTAVDASGRTVSLADFKGKHVVLEWVNPGCPYVMKHYGAGNMQATQKFAVDKGVVWLSINSTSQDASDYLAPAAMATWMGNQKAVPTATLIDSEGKVGRAYGARTTPHMYIVDPAGKLAYAGAIDSKASSNPADIPAATNHIKQALGESLAGKPVSTPITRPYGCSVKYSSGA